MVNLYDNRVFLEENYEIAPKVLLFLVSSMEKGAYIKVTKVYRSLQLVEFNSCASSASRAPQELIKTSHYIIFLSLYTLNRVHHS